MMGAASATLATETVRTVLTLQRTVKAGFPLPSPVRFWRVTLAASVMAAVLLLIRPGSVLLAVPLGAAAYVLGLMACGAIRLRPGTWPALEL
jgi:hypothetical protein